MAPTLSRFRRDGSPALKITGERVVTPEGGFNPTWQRHVAAYALSEPKFGPEPLLDLGCGVGHSYHLLAPRTTVGVDIDPAALEGQERETRVADMRRLPFADGSFASILSVHSLEHVPDPERVVAEVARVLAPGGTAVFVTPNRITFGRPDEIIDPFHHIEFDAGELRELCLSGFEEVQVEGIFGSARYMELHDEERRTLDRLLRLDPLRLRRLVPMRGKQYLYDTLLNRFRKEVDPRAEAIQPGDFFLGSEGLEAALDVVATCRAPRGRPLAAPPSGRGLRFEPSWEGEPAGSCNWCRAELGSEAVRRPGRAECPACGAATTDPVPTEGALAEAYGQWYWPSAGKRFGLIGDALLRRSRASMASRIDQVAPPGPILDVGAGEGTLIDALARRGREARGTDRESGHPDVHDLPIDQADGAYAGIVFWHSLEHLPDPAGAIEQAAAKLLAGGVVFVAVPDYASVQSRAIGDAWLHLDLPRHLTHLTTASLTEGLARNRLRVRSTSRTRAGQVVIGWLDGLVWKLPGRLDLYQALRRRSARRVEMSSGERAASILAGVILFPVALACAGLEIARGRSGTVYVEAHLE